MRACRRPCCPFRHPRSSHAQCVRIGEPSDGAGRGCGSERRRGLDLAGARSTSLAVKLGSVP
jgi:hypothetical protein